MNSTDLFFFNYLLELSVGPEEDVVQCKIDKSNGGLSMELQFDYKLPALPEKRHIKSVSWQRE
jgi:hypothetical protein